MVRRFEALQNGTETVTAEPAIASCPSCGAPIPVDQIECAECSPNAAPPIASSLFRLIRFARPRFGAALLGCVLTVAGTAVGLIPPYLTMPLLDKVLIPHQAGKQPIDFWVVGLYLAGLAGAAILAWLLSWARTYVVAWVSERIAADLRNQAYAHLQKLSLEFFGGKRTGDLMSRLSTDTDRICYFLSVTSLDFATDVLMITMTAGIDLTRGLLRYAGVPVPEGRPVSDADDAWEAAREIVAAVVVKPQFGNQGRGVATNLTTREQITAAYAAAREESSDIIVERFAPGADFRLLVVGDKVVAAARRKSSATALRPFAN